MVGVFRLGKTFKIEEPKKQRTSEQEGIQRENLLGDKKSQGGELKGLAQRSGWSRVWGDRMGEGLYRSIKILYVILRNLDFIYYVCVEYLPYVQNCLDSQIKPQDPVPAHKEA